MSLKNYIKANAPRSVIPLLKFFYHRFQAYTVPKAKPLAEEQIRDIEAHAKEYLPYYQDELSREILSDCLEYLRTQDENIFIEITKKSGIKFFELPYIWKDASGVILVYDNDNPETRYARRTMTSLELTSMYRIMTLKEFLDGAKISDAECIVPALTVSGEMKFAAKFLLRNIKAEVIDVRAFHLCREDLQYLDVFSPIDDEIIVDAGAYDGTTALQFLEWGKDRVKHIYSFEFDPNNAAKCEENLKPYADKITLIKKGTWDKDGITYTSAGGGASSRINFRGSTQVQLASIDSELAGVPVTFIKMDVEGAELKSLMGAKNTIIKNHPRLAICVYHKPEDIYEIPGYILSLVPEYKFYLRHYDTKHWETVLYAYCE